MQYLEAQIKRTGVVVRIKDERGIKEKRVIKQRN